MALVRLPDVRMTESGEVHATVEPVKSLKIQHVPVMLTFAVIEEYSMV